MNRREFLASSAAVGTGLIAGCSSSEPPPTATATPDPTPARTEAKTPLDATATPTTTPTATTTTTPTPSPTPIPSDYLRANYQPFTGRTSYFVGYSLTEAKLSVHPNAVPDDFPDTGKVFVATYGYPLGRLVRYGTSDTFATAFETPRTVTVEMDTASNPAPEYLHHVALLVPADASIENLSGAETNKLGETNRFRVSGGEMSRAPHPDALPAETTSAFERTPAEGAYLLRFDGTTAGQRWSAQYLVYKSVYIERIQTPRGRDRAEYVTVAQQQGLADALGRILDRAADENGFTSKRERAAFLIDYVQSLPYVPDDVSKGFDDYTKFVTETVAEGGGDCEDTAILMAALLQSAPFGYDCTLILLPGHMATGVYGTDLPGAYYTFEGRRYYYLETTGEGWGVGDIPDAYRNEQARLFQV